MPSPRAQYSIGAAAIAGSLVVGLALGHGGEPQQAGAPAATSHVQRSREAAREPVQPHEAAFWQTIADTRQAAGGNTGKQAELLAARLRNLSPEARADFARIHHSLDRRAYTWRLWGAAQVMEDGCSDDCFRDFRAYMISLGPGPYQRALANPDSLAMVAEDRETGNWEEAFVPEDETDLSGEPRGVPFDGDDDAGLARRYPRLTARFR
jgi:hypothetical protein